MENQSEFGLDANDHGARMSFSRDGRWHNMEPLAEKYPWMSPYAFSANNPLKYVDPDGFDWVYNTESQGYEWMDDVTSVEGTPEGYEYVGPFDHNILDHMGLEELYYQSGGWAPYTTWNIEKANTRFSAAILLLLGGIEGLIGAQSEGNLRFHISSILSKENVTENNKTGKIFKFLVMSAGFSQDTSFKYAGAAKLNIHFENGDSYQTSMVPHDGHTISKTNAYGLMKNVYIPAENLKNSSLSKVQIITNPSGTSSAGLNIKLNFNF